MNTELKVGMQVRIGSRYARNRYYDSVVGRIGTVSALSVFDDKTTICVQIERQEDVTMATWHIHIIDCMVTELSNIDFLYVLKQTKNLYYLVL